MPIITKDNVQKNIHQLYKRLRLHRPRTKHQLAGYVRLFCGLRVPARAVCEDHNAPLDYLWHSYSCDFPELPGATRANQSPDCIVWAGRGGGKTMLAAAATLMDSLFKPGCRTRILAGSLEQSSRMYDYLRDFIENGFHSQVKVRPGADICRFINGSDAAVLSHSSQSVRGQHIQKLRCDEVELFRSEVFTAAQFITKSADNVRGALEVFSTMHQPFGIMQKLIEASNARDSLEICGSQPHLFRWCLWESIERCGPDRICSQCPLWGDCSGKARRASGHLKIDDVIVQMRRSSRAGFETEMLCMRPRLEDAVFAEFSAGEHIAATAYNPNLPLYRTIDFGFRSPFVCLWIQPDDQGRIRVIDEYLMSRAIVQENAEAVRKRTPCPESAVAATFCDPAGAARNDVTGTSAVSELAEAGIRCKFKTSAILNGIELIRRALRAGDKKSRLIIDPKCRRLIEAMRCYHYHDSSRRKGDELPDKDGVYDHPIDALRYFFVNYERIPEFPPRRY